MASDYSGPSEETAMLLQAVLPLGLTSNQPQILRNVALTLSKGLTYQNVTGIFREDAEDYQVAQDSLVLLEMTILLFEHWAASYLKSDKYLRGLAVGILEVLVHSVAFWARLKQSSVITKLLLKV